MPMTNGRLCIDLGPLHTWAKSYDHKIARAQKKCPKVVQDTSNIDSRVVMTSHYNLPTSSETIHEIVLWYSMPY